MALLNRNGNVAHQYEPAAERVAIPAELHQEPREVVREYVDSTSANTSEHFEAEESQSTSISVAQYHANDLTAPERRQGGVIEDLANVLANAGLEGFRVDSRTFPIVSLKTDGIFEDTQARSWGKEIRGEVLRATVKWVLTAGTSEEKNEETIFSPDKLTTATGEQVSDVFARWQEEGREYHVKYWKEYRDLLLAVEMPGHENDGDIVILSVSPTSVGRWNGAAFKKVTRLSGRYRIPTEEEVVQALQDFTLVASVGAKVGTGNKAFYPWSFAFVRKS